MNREVKNLVLNAAVGSYDQSSSLHPPLDLQLPNKHVQELAEFLSRLSLLRFTLGTQFVLCAQAIFRMGME